MFYIISRTDIHSPSREKLINSCIKKGIEYSVCNPDTFDPTAIEFSKSDSFYRIPDTLRARQLDIYLTRQGCRSIKLVKKGVDFTQMYTITRYTLCVQAGINCIPSIYFPMLIPDKLLKQVELLGGFPVIIKEMGSLGGKGIMKVDSMSSLLSILRTVMGNAGGDIVLKKYIEHDEQARIIVLDGHVIGQKGNMKNGHDVVLNSGAHLVQEKREYSTDINRMAIAATRAVRLSFAGVDILIGKDGKNYLAEVNMRPAFEFVEAVNEVNIAGQIVDFLN